MLRAPPPASPDDGVAEPLSHDDLVEGAWVAEDAAEGDGERTEPLAETPPPSVNGADAPCGDRETVGTPPGGQVRMPRTIPPVPSPERLEAVRRAREIQAALPGNPLAAFQPIVDQG